MAGGRTYKVIGKCPICQKPFMKRALIARHIQNHSKKVVQK